MKRIIGTVVRSLRAPIIKEGTDIICLVTQIINNLWTSEKIIPKDKDIVAVTESIIARAQGNYASINDISLDINRLYGKEPIGLVFPILSRNRFSACLKGICRNTKDIIIMFSYPSDEVGNQLIPLELIDDREIDPYNDIIDEQAFRDNFGYIKHTFTGIDYIKSYKETASKEGSDCKIFFCNKPSAILNFTKNVLCCDIHTRMRTKKLLLKAGAHIVHTLDDILREPVNGRGYNNEYGLLGSNLAAEETIKLFPRDCHIIVREIQKRLKILSGRTIEVMAYGDGAFKDPVGKIWELADPVVSPGYTDGLKGTPNELKLKFLADNTFSHLSGKHLEEAISEYIKKKTDNLKGSMLSQGTTPRHLTDLLGSLCDLTSGSGDKGTPLIYIQGYFDNFSDSI